MSRVLAAAAAALLATTTPAIATEPDPLAVTELEVTQGVVDVARSMISKGTRRSAHAFRDLRAFTYPEHTRQLLGRAAKGEFDLSDDAVFHAAGHDAIICGLYQAHPRALWRWWHGAALGSLDPKRWPDQTGAFRAETMDRLKPRLVRKFFAVVPFCMPDEATLAAWSAANAMREAEIAAAPEHCGPRGCLRELPPADALRDQVSAELRDRLDEPTYVRFGEPVGLEDVAEGSGILCGEVQWGETEQMLAGRRWYAVPWHYDAGYREPYRLQEATLYDAPEALAATVPGCAPTAPLAGVSN